MIDELTLDTAPVLLGGGERTAGGVGHLLFGISHRMLGTVADAEDVVQESWRRRAAHRPGRRGSRSARSPRTGRHASTTGRCPAGLTVRVDEQYDGTPAAVLTTPAGVFAVVTTDVDPEGDCPHITAVRTIRQAKSAGDRLLALRL
ncbi:MULTISPECIES: hypothetical protein [unclassified Streptomyces]|uniref:hypothetical protein n=1 Tax=unclassified Streptomyces TaxID=2593676 RepID=UPI0019266BB3|nr:MULTISPECIES: hypothetical protein [unclassified Streptomyces]